MAQSWWQLDWIWTTTAWLLGALGLALLLWALFSDRSRGRRRCPKCWYDLTGVPGTIENARELLTCPECGRRSPARRLHRTRRKWRASVLALLILFASFAAANWRDYAAGGWVRIIPSTALAFWAPTEFAWSAQGTAARIPLLGGTPIIGAAFAPRPVAPRQRIGEEVWRRLYEGRLWMWQSQIFLQRALNQSAMNLPDRVHVSPRWPIGEPVPTFVETSLTHSHPFDLEFCRLLNAKQNPGVRQDDLFEVSPTGAGPEREVTVPIALRTDKGVIVYTLNVRRAVSMAKSWDDIFRHDATPQTSERIQRAMDPRLSIQQGDLTLVLDDRSTDPNWRSLTLGMGCRIEVTVNGEPAATGIFRPQWSKAIFKSWEELRIEWQPGMKAKARAAPESVRVTIRGDPAISGEIYRMWPFVTEDPECWTGSFTTTPRLVERPEKFSRR